MNDRGLESLVPDMRQFRTTRQETEEQMFARYTPTCCPCGSIDMTYDSGGVRCNICGRQVYSAQTVEREIGGA